MKSNYREAVCLDELVAAHPDYEETLRELLPAMSLVRGKNLAEVIAEQRVSVSPAGAATPSTDLTADQAATPWAAVEAAQDGSQPHRKQLQSPAEETRKLDQAATATLPAER